MAKDGLLLLLCAAMLVWLAALLPAQEPDLDRRVQDTLAVQTALQRGRELTQRGDHANAVHVLESQLARINGNPTYLATLREAYRGYIKELKLASKEEEAQRYLQRLQVLDPGVGLDLITQRGAKAAADPPAAAPPAPPAPPAKLSPEIQQVRADQPVSTPTATATNSSSELLAKADQEFRQRRYQEAGTLYDQVARIDAKLVSASRERWAYCKLYRVVEQLNQTQGVPPEELEKEVLHALELAPRLEYGKQLLAEIQRRRSGNGAAATVQVQHFERGADGWARAETANFRIFHNQSRDVCEQVAQIAERTRTEMGIKWFGGLKETWNPRCDLYLHATSADYSKATGVPTSSPGHSSIKHEGARVLARRIDLHCDNLPNLLQAVLPHETTHVVLAGQFDQPVPRWADEGIAVLTEPRHKIDLHLQNLSRCRKDNTLFPVRQLILLQDYPSPRQISAFYAQSVSLVEYLANEKGPQAFSAYLREALRTNDFEGALRRHYGYSNFDDLQHRWATKAFSSGGVAQGQ